MFRFLYIFAFAIGCSIATPTLELVSPQGFRISIPDDSRIALYAYDSANNRPQKATQADSFGEAFNQMPGRWVYENRNPTDVLIHVESGNTPQNDYMDERNLNSIPNDPSSNETLIGSVEPISRAKRTTIDEWRKWMNTLSPAMDSLSSITMGKLAVKALQFCEFSDQTTVNGRKACKERLIFSDDFDTIDWNKWQREIKIPIDTGCADFVTFQNRPENCYVHDGNLNIVPNLLVEVPGFDENRIRRGDLKFGANCTGHENIELECNRKAEFFRILPPVVSAKIRTKDSFSFRYGRVEVRAKLPRGDWLFPIISLEPADNYYGVSGYASGQMLVAFNRGNEYLTTQTGNEIDGRRVSGGVMLTNGAAYRDNWMRSSLRADHLGNDFHVYSMTWTNESIALAVDGHEYAVLPGGYKDVYRTHNIAHAQSWSNGEFMAPFDKEFYISLGVSAGGISNFPDDVRNGQNEPHKPWANSSPKSELKFWNDHEKWHSTWKGEDAGLKVDYVRVYSL